MMSAIFTMASSAERSMLGGAAGGDRGSPGRVRCYTVAGIGLSRVTRWG
ncbi:hypothetical protein FHX44_111358 [Pseudonocardia hierapolitana]|uniref:Uncharacterized protein n=1 Tax=Pseudonocardia hierapolitana TaxID=1128676 RepID=A0A561SKU0_9PSEU|nr:hypothetical protein FHX44_111358 [Pseudonocardia hierapolitana]